MTHLQKQICWQLLNGGTIAKYPGYPCRLRDTYGIVVMKFNESSFNSLKHLLRRRKDGLFVIDKKEVRKQRGSTWIKKSYKLINGAYAIS